jgi:uncharacterized paraquat-inducible protein A
MYVGRWSNIEIIGIAADMSVFNGHHLLILEPSLVQGIVTANKLVPFHR